MRFVILVVVACISAIFISDQLSGDEARHFGVLAQRVQETLDALKGTPLGMLK